MKFTSIIISLLLAPSKAADVPATSGAAHSKLGGKSTRNMEEEALMPGGGGEKKSDSCATENAFVAIEQAAFSLEATYFIGLVYGMALAPNPISVPSIEVFLKANYDEDGNDGVPFECDMYGSSYVVIDSIFSIINRYFSEMSCEQYAEAQELMKEGFFGMDMGYMESLKAKIGSAAFVKAIAGDNGVKQAGYAFFGYEPCE